MKTFGLFSLLCATVLTTAPGHANIPSLSGDWVVNDFEVSFDASPGGFGFVQPTVDSDTFSIGSVPTALIDGEIFYFGFDDGFLVGLSGAGSETIALSSEIDTFVTTVIEPFPGGASIRASAGIRRPTGNFASSDLEGSWISLDLTIISSREDGEMEETFTGIYQLIDQFDLNPNGTFSYTNLSATSSALVEPGFSGTWAPDGRGVSLTVGAESLQLDAISAGGDTGIEIDTEIFDNGGFVNIDRSFRLYIKEAPSLTESDVIGDWGFNRVELDTAGDPENFVQFFGGGSFDFARISLLSGGQGRALLLGSSEGNAAGTVIDFSWQISGNRLILFAEGADPVSLHVSAGKDFAAGMFFENVGGSQGYELVSVVKLPDTPPLFTARPSLTPGATPSLGIGSQAGVYYQLEKSGNLSTWSPIGAPILGDGNEITEEDPAPHPGGGFYRWRAVPGPN
jgi:hypothetical protein